MRDTERFRNAHGEYWEDYELGFRFKTTSITVTETHIVNWACLTMDHYQLHMDAEYCKGTVFGERVAHGPLIFAMAVGMVAMTGVGGDAVSAWMGVDNMRMLAPVRMGDTITTVVEIIDVKETSKPAQGIQRWQYTVKNQHDKPVMRFEMVFMMPRKPAS
ncbi:MaoC family dehydratase [Syntrophomonas curvata]